jgi:hypothetical protein
VLVLGVLTPAGVLWRLATSHRSALTAMYEADPGLRAQVILEDVVQIALVVAGMWAAYRIVRRRAGSVVLARSVVGAWPICSILLFGSASLLVHGASRGDVQADLILLTERSCVAAVVCLWYLAESKRVKNVFPDG